MPRTSPPLSVLWAVYSLTHWSHQYIQPTPHSHGRRVAPATSFDFFGRHQILRMSWKVCPVIGEVGCGRCDPDGLPRAPRQALRLGRTSSTPAYISSTAATSCRRHVSAILAAVVSAATPSLRSRASGCIRHPHVPCWGVFMGIGANTGPQELYSVGGGILPPNLKGDRRATGCGCWGIGRAPAGLPRLRHKFSYDKPRCAMGKPCVSAAQAPRSCRRSGLWHIPGF